MNLFARRFFLTLSLVLLSSVAYFALAADVNINANIPGGGGPGNTNLPISGCTDPSATNYNPSATTNDGSCQYAISGCTDPTATNYNSSATVDDGSCQYAISGCTDPIAINYNPSATIDDGSCQLPVPGCTDPTATNYNAQANQDDGSCQYAISGCTDPTATNYNSQATIDNGSCTYQVSGCTNPLATNYNAQATIDDGSCVISGCMNPAATNYNAQATIDDGSCVISGCTDPTAINYNPQATIDNGSCSYDPNQVPGCMDASAVNYNPQATIDNGSCSYPSFGCTDNQALNYDSNASVNNGTCVYGLPTVPPGSGFEPSYYFFTNNNGLELFLQNNNIDLLINHDLLIVVPNNFNQEVNKITAVVGGEILSFKYDSSSNQYILSLNNFNSLGQRSINLLIVYADNSAQGRNITVTTHPLGHVFSKLPKDVARIFGISVSLYDENNNLIVQLNKINQDGTYGFMVKNGRYKLVVFDNGQKIYDGRLFSIKNNIINRDIGLTLLEQIIKTIQETLDNPIVEETNKYTAPAVVSVVSVSTFVAIPWWSFVNYLQYLFTEPLAWIFRRKKKGWGVVYNSITKKPIDLAVVRLYDKSTGKLLKSRVTDKEGRYSFLVSEGDYTLEVVKPNMIFPSGILKDLIEDKQFTNLYHGEVINITKDQKGIITANVPIDPQDAKVSDKEILRKNLLYKVHKNISLIGPIFALISFAIFPSVLMGSFAVFHIVLYFLFRRLAAREKVNKWGVILDAKTGKPVAGTIAKIYSPEYNKMLEAQVTDRHGRYGFLAGNNVYYIAATKEGYTEAKTNTIDLTHRKSEEVIGQDLELHPLDNQPLSDNETKTDQSNKPDELLEDNSDLTTSKLEVKEPEIKATEKFTGSEDSPLQEMAAKLKQEAEKNLESKDNIQNITNEQSVDKNINTPTELQVEKIGDDGINTASQNVLHTINKEDKFG